MTVDSCALEIVLLTYFGMPLIFTTVCVAGVGGSHKCHDIFSLRSELVDQERIGLSGLSIVGIGAFNLL